MDGGSVTQIVTYKCRDCDTRTETAWPVPGGHRFLHHDFHIVEKFWPNDCIVVKTVYRCKEGIPTTSKELVQHESVDRNQGSVAKT
jgi:hypothetical protein